MSKINDRKNFIKGKRLIFSQAFKNEYNKKLRELELSGFDFKSRRKLYTFKSNEWMKEFGDVKSSNWHLSKLIGDGSKISNIIEWATNGGNNVSQYFRTRITLGAKWAEYTKGISIENWKRLKVISVLLIENSIENDPRGIYLLPRSMF